MRKPTDSLPGRGPPSRMPCGHIIDDYDIIVHSPLGGVIECMKCGHVIQEGPMAKDIGNRNPTSGAPKAAAGTGGTERKGQNPPPAPYVFISAIFDPETLTGLDAKVFPSGYESEEYLDWAEKTSDPRTTCIEEQTTVESFIRRHPWAKPFLDHR